ncbi:MAG TPA: hypothetical protein DEH07_06615 [Desulfotomaculum sp.]|nr:hypothetical protein [Desulfotomaculum sp.]
MLPTFYGENAFWFKFSRYETFKSGNEIYIIPAQGAERTIYNPCNVGDRLITDYLEYGKLIFEGLENNLKMNGALSLVRKYGLLGFLTFVQYSRFRVHSKEKRRIFLRDDNGEYTKEKILPEYISEYFPLLNRQSPSLDRHNEDEHLQYDNNYSECVSWIAKKACDLYTNFKNIEDFKRIKEIENLPDNEYIRKIFDCRFKIRNIDLYVHFDEIRKAYLNWKADSLLEMIDILYALKLIDEKNGLAECKNQNCKKPFLKHRKNMKYCSDNCGNSYRVVKCINGKKIKLNTEGGK